MPTAPVLSRQVVMGAAGGFVLALVLALALGLAGWWPGSAAGGSPSSAAVSLPARLGGYTRFADIPKNQVPQAASAVRNANVGDATTTAALSAAYRGAGAAVRTYGDDDLLTFFSVWVVRAGSPGLVVRFQDAEFLGLAVASRRVEDFGEVSCIVSYDPVIKGQPVREQATHTEQCQRSDAGMTVTVIAPTQDLAHRPREVAALVNQVWGLVH